MLPTPEADATAIRDRFLADHRQLDVLSLRLLDALESADFEATARGWSEFREAMTMHMRAEASVLVPALLACRRRDVSPLLEEHRHFRTRLRELETALERHTMSAAMARGFLDELRAHFAHEQNVLSRWAQGPYGAE